MTILIVANDAGGANILAAWVKKNFQKRSFLFCLSGPAKNIFAARSFGARDVSLEEYFSLLASKNGFVLTGTSDVADSERQAIAKAKRQGVKCASFLDHWLNYRQRFCPNSARSWLNYLPDEVWVGDRFAFRLALREGFPKEKLKLVPNPYFEEIKKRGKKTISSPGKGTGKVPRQGEGKTILYVSEPVCDVWEKKFGKRGEWNFSEFQHLENLLNGLMPAGKKVSSLVVRLHPKEAPDKYDKIIGSYQKKMRLLKSKEPELLFDIAKADIVVGVESMALVTAMLLGKQVFSILPKGLKTVIPYKEIIKLNSAKQLVDYL